VASPFGPLVLICNARAGRGELKARLPRIRAELDARGLDHDVAFTAGPGEASDIACSALQRGQRFLVAVGGDGTIHEVVNGILSSGSADAVLGVVAAGTGSDFIRTFGLPRGLPEAVERLAGDGIRRIDGGRVTYTTPEGSRTRFFANIAEAGIGAAVVARARRLPGILGASVYFWAFWLTAAAYRPCTVRVSCDSWSFEGRANNVVVANGRFFGGGMRIAPVATPDDGALDVQVDHARRSESLRLMRRVYEGAHVPHPRIAEATATWAEVDAARPLAVEADGEVLGTTPARFEILPGAITLKI
jgi:YegS/Rv2252/BmrU family lipid kinase